MPAKRRRESVTSEDVIAVTPKKIRFGKAVETPTKTTPTKSTIKQRTQRRSSAVEEQQADKDELLTPQTARSRGKSAFTTPVRQSTDKEPEDDNATTVEAVTYNADKSARRKTNKNLIERTIAGDVSDEEQDALAQQIWDEDEAQEAPDSETEPEESNADAAAIGYDQAADGPVTPSKRGRGRPKGSKNRRTPTPPPNLPPYERYFFQNRPSAAKSSSSNTISSFTLLSHSAYHNALSTYEDRHASSIASLHDLHASSFPLWAFELSQGFTVCLYGYGAKSKLLTSFADYLHSQSPPSSAPVTILINGHHPSLSLRSLLLTVASGLDLPAASLPNSVPTLLAHITAHLSTRPPSAPRIYLLISTLTARVLTATPGPTVLSTLAIHPAISTVLTASIPTFPLLWPSATRDALNILFHDATTFLPYDHFEETTTIAPLKEVGKGNKKAEAEATGTVSMGIGIGISELGTSVVDSVAELLGKRGAEAAGRERVRWVLKSLPENARGLYRILVSEILASAAAVLDDETTRGDRHYPSSDEDEPFAAAAAAGGNKKNPSSLPGIDSKLLYQKASEEFLCSSEMAFRGLLREFVDHAMVTVGGQDDSGERTAGEMLRVDMSREELEGVLEDLTG